MVNIPLIVKGSKVRRDFGIQDISLGNETYVGGLET